MEFSLKDIGLSVEELQNRVVESISDSILRDRFSDEDGNVVERYDSEFRSKATEKITESINIGVAKLVNQYVNNNIDNVLLSIVIQQTNRYGEKKGEPQTFVEYIADYIGKYLNEQVNEKGETRDRDSYSWEANSTRAMWMVDQAIKNNLQEALNTVLKNSNTTIAQAISESVRMSTEALLKQFKVTYPDSAKK